MQRWQEVKNAHKDCIIFFRLGDFYEMFFEDAEVSSRILGLTLTGRGVGENRVPMCGIPFHAASTYIKKLIERGHRVAVCEQLSAPQKGKALVERDVTKVITPGTYTDESFLEQDKNNFVAAVLAPPAAGAAPPFARGETGVQVSAAGGQSSIAWCDITTGEFFATATEAGKVGDVLAMINPREVIDSGGHFAYAFNTATAYESILRYFKITSTEIFDLKKGDRTINAAGALLEYLMLTQKQTLANITRIRVIKNGDYMVMDKTARDNLEINTPFRAPNQKKGSLLWVLDDTQTAMGARELVSWLNKPLQSIAVINERLDAVETLVNDSATARNLRSALAKIADISRLCGKVATKDITPRDFLAIARSLEQLGEVKKAMHPALRNHPPSLREVPLQGGELVTGCGKESALDKSLALQEPCAGKSKQLTPRTCVVGESRQGVAPRSGGGVVKEAGVLEKCHDSIVLLPGLASLIERAIADDPPVKTDAGGYIRDGYSVKLDELRNAGTAAAGWLSKLEQKEREETKLRELKVAYNRVAGYYFEIPSRLSAQVPYRFTRKGSTINTERFITPELKELENKILNAQTNAIELEAKLLGELRLEVLKHLETLMKNAQTVAILDVLQSFAFVAIANDYVRPKLNQKGAISLKDARHPVVERLIGESHYIANDCEMQNNTMLITGPNMAGKSTFMRMVAHIVIMAHMGSFVPCAGADVALTDRIFTRIGASDNLLTGESTFMVEMNEVSNIVHNAGKNSLVLLDEVGRGTGTSDGRALASAIITYITDKIGANTMFATHFHQLTSLAAGNPQIKNYKVLVDQIDNEIVFLHKLQAGIEQNSFGIDVARLSGLPKEIIDNARRLLT